MAKAIGARVITTAGSPEKVKICEELGADLAINYKTDDVDAEIRQVRPWRRECLVGIAARAELSSAPSGCCTFAAA